MFKLLIDLSPVNVGLFEFAEFDKILKFTYMVTMNKFKKIVHLVSGVLLISREVN